MIKRGPVDVVVMASGAPRFDGSAFEELKKQTAAGTIRVLDAMILLKDEAGEPWRLNLEDLPAEQKAAVGFITAGAFKLFDGDDATTLYEGMVPGSAVVAFAIEHVWAIDLVNTLDNAGVELAMSFRVPAPIVDEAFASLVVKA
jgi:hypothetical protein